MLSFVHRLIGEEIHFDWHLVTITVASTLLLIVEAYHATTLYEHWDRVVLYLAVPLLFIMIVFRENPREYGFSLGDWKAGITITCLGIVVMTPFLHGLGQGNASLKSYYQEQVNGLPWTTFLDLIGWEFLFRGWILFGYARRFGTAALWLQVVPFAMAHLGKPELETLSTVFGGFALGWVAWRTRSFVWPFLIHWFIATFLICVAAGLV